MERLLNHQRRHLQRQSRGLHRRRTTADLNHFQISFILFQCYSNFFLALLIA